MSFNYLLIANRLLPAHTYDPAVAVCCNDLHLGTSAVTNWEIYLQQRSFLLNANSLRRSTCSWSQDFVSVVPSLVELKKLENLRIGTDLLLHKKDTKNHNSYIERVKSFSRIINYIPVK